MNDGRRLLTEQSGGRTLIIIVRRRLTNPVMTLMTGRQPIRDEMTGMWGLFLCCYWLET